MMMPNMERSTPPWPGAWPSHEDGALIQALADERIRHPVLAMPMLPSPIGETQWYHEYPPMARRREFGRQAAGKKEEEVPHCPLPLGNSPNGRCWQMPLRLLNEMQLRQQHAVRGVREPRKLKQPMQYEAPQTDSEHYGLLQPALRRVIEHRPASEQVDKAAHHRLSLWTCLKADVAESHAACLDFQKKQQRLSESQGSEQLLYTTTAQIGPAKAVANFDTVPPN